METIVTIIILGLSPFVKREIKPSVFRLPYNAGRVIAIQRRMRSILKW
jgi:hypothetical protein